MVNPEFPDKARDGPSLVRAAEYVRMSTDHQRYSTETQAAAIQTYAARRGMEIVRTYADEGKSGLRIEGRDALKQLIETVASGNADFDVILVYDISRWGRFQDALSTAAKKPATWRRKTRPAFGRRAPRQQRSPDSWRLPGRFGPSGDNAAAITAKAELRQICTA